MLRKLTGPGLFRLFLALLVFVHHTTRLALGNCAVFIFFSLSGFWIYKMYTGRYAKARQPYLTYLASRFWRLYPTFWLISILILAFVYLRGKFATIYQADHLSHFVLSNCFIFGYSSLFPRPIIPAWSLDIEMQYYIIAPVFAILLMRRIVRPGWMLLAVCAVSLCSAATGNKIPILSYLFFFLIGMTAASTSWQPSRKLVTTSSFFGLLLIAMCIISPWREILLIGLHRTPLAAYNVHANLILAVLAAPYAIYTTTQKGFAADEMFGDLSYVVYLLHWAGAMWFGSVSGSQSRRLQAAGIAWFLVLALSVAIWKYFDKPINRMRARWVRSRIQQTAPSAPAARAATVMEG
jgi:peptidoglycan/LPS O-acetylase OafA/YrhL